MNMSLAIYLLATITGVATVILGNSPSKTSGDSTEPAMFLNRQEWLHTWSPQKLGGQFVNRRNDRAGSFPRAVRQVYFDPLPEYLVPAVPGGQQGSQMPQRPRTVRIKQALRRPQPERVPQALQRPQAIQVLPASQASPVQPTDSAPSYAFEYKVKHPPSGVDFGHRESRDGLLTTGSYRVALPDGRMQVVDYRANRTGYKANIQYIAQSQETQQGRQGQQTLRQQQQQILWQQPQLRQHQHGQQQRQRQHQQQLHQQPGKYTPRQPPPQQQRHYLYRYQGR